MLALLSIASRRYALLGGISPYKWPLLQRIVLVKKLLNKAKYIGRHPMIFLDELIAALLRPFRAYLQRRKVFKLDVDPTINFFIVSCGRNTGQSVINCLQSVYDQRIEKRRVRHLLIDDDSDDETAQLIFEWLEKHPDNSVKFVLNKFRKGGTLNTLEAFRQAPKDSVLLELNSDDSLSDPMVLDFLGRVYSDNQVWMTYNSYEYSNNTMRPRGRPYPFYVVRKNSYRDYEWVCQHLHSFRSSLLKHLPDEVFIDPETGDYFSCADDRSIYWSLLELCGKQAICLYRTAYTYNFHEFSDMKTNPVDSIENVNRIRKMPRFTQLESL